MPGAYSTARSGKRKNPSSVEGIDETDMRWVVKVAGGSEMSLIPHKEVEKDEFY